MSFASLRMTISMYGVARASIDPDPRHGMLPLNRKQERLLKRLRDPAQETRGVGAINQPVIVRERERQNQARLKFVVDPFGFHPRTREAENRNLGMIDDRRKSRAADSTEIRDRKRAARHFFGRQLLVFGLLRDLRQ